MDEHDLDDDVRRPARQWWRRASVVALAVLSAVAGSVWFPAPAAADKVTSWDTDPGGVVGVSAHGQARESYPNTAHIRCDVSGWIHDTRGDGHRVGIQVEYFNERRKLRRIYHTGGVGTVRWFDVTVYGDGGLSPVRIREFVSEGTDFVKAGDWNLICGQYGGFP